MTDLTDEQIDALRESVIKDGGWAYRRRQTKALIAAVEARARREERERIVSPASRLRASKAVWANVPGLGPRDCERVVDIAIRALKEATDE